LVFESILFNKPDGVFVVVAGDNQVPDGVVRMVNDGFDALADKDQAPIEGLAARAGGDANRFHARVQNRRGFEGFKGGGRDSNELRIGDPRPSELGSMVSEPLLGFSQSGQLLGIVVVDLAVFLWQMGFLRVKTYIMGSG